MTESERSQSARMNMLKISRYRNWLKAIISKIVRYLAELKRHRNCVFHIQSWLIKDSNTVQFRPVYAFINLASPCCGSGSYLTPPASQKRTRNSERSIVS